MSRSPLVTFMGTTPNIGTTVAAYATACRLAEGSGMPVGYLCLNLKSSKLHRYLRVDRPGASLDRLRPDLHAAALTPEKLKLAAYRPPGLPNLYVLFGNLMRDQAEFYRPEEIEHLLDAAMSAFRLTVADVSAYWDNAATITANRLADSRVVVTTPALSHFQEDGRRWLASLSPLFGVPADAYETVIVEPPWRNGGYSMKDVQKEIGLASIGELRVTEPMLIGLDNGSLQEWLREDEQGRQAMRGASERLMDRYGVRFGGQLVQRPWYRKLLAHRNGAGS
jgi:hypothetical protein